MPTNVRLVTEPDELLAVQRQRYTIYVEELKYPQKWADHEARIVAEPLDATGHILGAFDDNGTLIGSIRLNYGHDTDFGEYVDLYHMDQFGPYFPRNLVLTTKLMLAPEHRCRGLMHRLALASFAHTQAHYPDTAFGLIDTKPPLDAYFRRLGFRQTGPMISHPAAGQVVPMVFVFGDIDYLRDIGSPFAKLRPATEHTESVHWYQKAFAC